ncbi:MAG: STAS domain-containing protein [Pseudomonadaceae bacterium]|jgi:phospholipid transport system transporter-binding protein|nr:STAS domain-containing protein [Pseudomonadaceae bacterium]
MSQASIRQGAAGELLLVGVLDYRTAPALREAGRQLIAKHPASALKLSCAQVEKSSSVGLSLLLAFMRDAKAANKRLAVFDLPADMREIAQVSGLLEIFSQPN